MSRDYLHHQSPTRGSQRPLASHHPGLWPSPDRITFKSRYEGFNKKINTIRYLIERSIAQLKTWRILHTDYRRPYATFTTTINAVLGIIFTYTL